ncbi:MAG: hypothetical protein KAR36_06295 [Candidatus Latescibacteria bacterium]|nr:hypothetical protein [Candidatus Latescibacterota bacterium]
MNKREHAIQDPDLAQVGKALRRAAKQARKIAQQTGTPLVIYEDGKVVKKMIVQEDGASEL